MAASLARNRRRYRLGQTAVLFALATLAVLAASVGPMYERSVERASVRTTLASAPLVPRGLTINLDASTSVHDVTPRGRAASLFTAPVESIEVPVGITVVKPSSLVTTLTYRDEECAHLVLVAGRCTSGRGGTGDVVASAALAARLHLRLGSNLHLRVPGTAGAVSISRTVQIVGLYRTFGSVNDYWFGAHYSSASGITVSSDAVRADALFGTHDYITATAVALNTLQDGQFPHDQVLLALRPNRVGVDDLPVLRRLLTAESARPISTITPVSTGLPDLLAGIERDRSSARRGIYPSALALVLLTLLALGVVTAAAADERRPELALARLRGYRVTAASWFFARELGAIVLAAVVPGLALAWAVTWAAGHLWLAAGARAQLTALVTAAVALVAFAMLVVVAAIAQRTSSQEISSLLRQLPRRSSRAAPRLAEAALAAAALAGLLASVGGGRHNALASVTPTLVALLVGLAFSRVLVFAARRGGRARLWRGALVPALAALSIARRAGSRLTVTVVCVSTALLIFAVQQWSTALTNQSERAAAETGAAVTLDVSTPSAARLMAAVRAADPSQRYATPVIAVHPPGLDAVPTVAVDPASFAAVADFGRTGLKPAPSTWTRLQPGSAAPSIRFTGTRIVLSVASVSITTLPADRVSKTAEDVELTVTHPDGHTEDVALGALPGTPGGSRTLSSAVDCAGGCRLTDLRLVQPATAQQPLQVSFDVAALSATSALRIGNASNWASTTTRVAIAEVRGKPTSMTASDTSAGLRFTAVDDGSGTSMQYLDEPVSLPALLAGPRPDAVDPLGYVTAATLDGGTGRVSITGTVPFIPQVGGSGLVEDLGAAIRASPPTISSTAGAQVWLGADDRTREARLVSTLRRDGVSVTARHSSAQGRHGYLESAPGWSAMFTLIVAATAELVSVGLLALVVYTSRLRRRSDLAALRTVGLSNHSGLRATYVELAVLVLTGVVAGAVAGIVGARLAVPEVPIFTTASVVPLPLTYVTAWTWLGSAVALSAVLLVAIAVLVVARVMADTDGSRGVR